MQCESIGRMVTGSIYHDGVANCTTDHDYFRQTGKTIAETVQIAVDFRTSKKLLNRRNYRLTGHSCHRGHPLKRIGLIGFWFSHSTRRRTG